MNSVFLPAAEGFVLGGSLIVAIGSQNAFILRQGLLRQNVFVLCFTAALSDAVLIALGVAGFGSIIQGLPKVLFWVTIAGAIFLFFYSLSAFRRSWKPQAMGMVNEGASSLAAALATLLAFTFLNPHVYLDTVILLGGISARYVGEARLAFGVGAVLVSFAWFFALGYGARWLTPLFAKPAAWRVLDGLIGAVMMLLAFTLLRSALSA